MEEKKTVFRRVSVSQLLRRFSSNYLKKKKKEEIHNVNKKKKNSNKSVVKKKKKFLWKRYGIGIKNDSVSIIHIELEKKIIRLFDFPLPLLCDFFFNAFEKHICTEITRNNRDKKKNVYIFFALITNLYFHGIYRIRKS